MFLSWAQGYLSGINQGSLVQGSHSYRDLSQTPEQIMIFLKEYCGANPSANFKDGVIQLLRSLPGVDDEDRPVTRQTIPVPRQKGPYLN